MAMPGDRRLWGLGAAHLGLGLASRALAPFDVPTPFGLERILVVPLVALALCQALLIALWGAASGASAWTRPAGLVAGAVYLEALLPERMRWAFRGTATLTIAVATASLLLARALGVRLARRVDPGPPAGHAAEGFRFSIRGLMLFTAAVARLSAGARAVQATPVIPHLLTAVWALGVVAVGLAALRAALGVGRPQRRGWSVLVLAPLLGAFVAVAARAHRAGRVYILLIMLLYAAALLGSLLVVRRCGYRLTRRAGPSPDPAPEGERAAGPISLGGPAVGATSPD
jgi:hypothetical protein